MSSTKAHSNNGSKVPETISRSSSLTVLTPVVKDGVSEIASKLGEVEGIIEDLDAELSPDAALLPDIGELLQEISELQKDIKGIKLAQDAQVRAIRDEVKDETKTQIVQLMGHEIESIVADAITTQVTEEMKEWSEKCRAVKFVSALEKVAEVNDGLIAEARIQLENSRSRHANSFLDIQHDFNARLYPVKRRDGGLSELWPVSLRELFSYDAEHLALLSSEYNLCPLDKHSENLNRFLIFVGVNASVSEQYIDPSEEQPPAYPLGNASWIRDEKTRKAARRASSASQDDKQNTNSSWYSRWPGSHLH